MLFQSRMLFVPAQRKTKLAQGVVHSIDSSALVYDIVDGVWSPRARGMVLVGGEGATVFFYVKLQGFLKAWT